MCIPQWSENKDDSNFVESWENLECVKSKMNMYFETAFWGIWDKLAMLSWERHCPYVSGSRKVKKFSSGVQYESLCMIVQLAQRLGTASSLSGMLTSWASHLQRKVNKPPQQWPYHHIHLPNTFAEVKDYSTQKTPPDPIFIIYRSVCLSFLHSISVSRQGPDPSPGANHMI